MTCYHKKHNVININTKEVAEKTGKKEKILCPHCEKILKEDFIAISFSRLFAKKGDMAKSERKTASCRENGLKGGRPKKQTAETK